MKKRRVSTHVFLCFLMMMFLMVIGCSSAENSILNPLNIHSISGTVNGVGSSVLITLSGDSSATTQTDATTGFYKFDSLKGGDYTVTPSLPGYTFNPMSTGVSLNGTNITATDINFTATASSGLTYSISGQVSGAILAGVTITLTGDISVPATTKTDANGNYSFPDLVLNGNYTVTPSIDGGGYTFSPISTGVIISGADETGINFTATANVAATYSISGQVTGATIAGVTITLSGGTFGTAITTTDGSGNYSFAGLLPGGYTVTPSKTGYTFSPVSLTPTIVAANIPNQNFTSSLSGTLIHSISGAVGGDVTSGVTINLTGAATATTTTGGGGAYSFPSLANGAYTVTPVLAGYTFAPASSAVTVAGVDIPGTNFTATTNTALKYSISGTVSGQVVSGVTITLSPGSATTITNGSGNYSFSGLVNGSYTVTPTLAGYAITPDHLSPTISNANIPSQNFVVGTAPAVFTQADLVGTWVLHDLKAGSTSKWFYAIVTVDSSGNVIGTNCLESSGSTACPTTGQVIWTVNSSGVITESGTGAGTNVNMKMTSNKNLIAGTSGSIGGSSAHLIIVQKVVTGTTYSNADLQNQSLVCHELRVGNQNHWHYWTGTTDASGMLTISSETDPSGTDTPGATGKTLSVGSTGAVGTNGFLSADKKTLVSVDTHTDTNGTSYDLSIIQVTGTGEFTPGPLAAGMKFSHMLGCGSSFAGWVHDTITVAPGGGMSFSDWADSFGGSAPSTIYTGNITDTSGTLTITGNPTFHGQISHDKKFSVGTQTPQPGVYFLNVTTN